MWYVWSTLLLVSCALASEAASVRGTDLPPQGSIALTQKTEATRGSESPQATEATEAPTPLAVATTRAPARTLDRKADELAWRSWLQSPESGNQNAPPRRITTKSLFITPLICPKGQRLDRNGCVQVLTVDKGVHESLLLEQLNTLFTSAPSGDIQYDYGEEETGPLQLSIPIGLDPQASPLQAQEPNSQADYTFINKKGNKTPESDISIEAELELLKLQNSNNHSSEAISSETTNILSHNVLNNQLPSHEKPKRDSVVRNNTEPDSSNISDEGQKEMVFGQVNIDPILYQLGSEEDITVNDTEIEKTTEVVDVQSDISGKINTHIASNHSSKPNLPSENKSKDPLEIHPVSKEVLKKDDQFKLNPENDYSDIGEAIKLISRFAEVTTDDNFGKDQKKYASTEENVLGTRTKLQHRRNKPKPQVAAKEPSAYDQFQPNAYNLNVPTHNFYPKHQVYFRYPWQGQNSQTPPPDYPFRHLQDYWHGRTRIGGVYNTVHENPRRHHHSYPHNSMHPNGYQYAGPYPDIREAYPGQIQGYLHRVAQHHANPMRSRSTDRDLYNLLGLRHWFSSGGTSKR